MQAWKLSGGRIVEFCNGKTIKLIEENQPIHSNIQDPFFNEIPLDENDIVQKRIADVVLEPLRTRAKREIILEEREKQNAELVRTRRQTGRFRGQTQSQYLNVGKESGKEGKAEAEATDQSSRAVVSEF